MISNGIQYGMILGHRKIYSSKDSQTPIINFFLGRQLKQIEIFAYGGQAGKCAEVPGVTPLFLIAMNIRKKTPKKSKKKYMIINPNLQNPSNIGKKNKSV